jgi:hypothetical protein
MKGVQLWSWVQHHRWLCVAFLAFLMVGTAGGTCWAVFFRTVASPVSLGQALRLYRRDHGATSTSPLASRVMTSGVFSYATTGGEGLNLVGMSRSFPDRTDMVVTNSSGSGSGSGSGVSCSTVQWVPLVQHTETTSICQSEDHSLAVSELISHEVIGGSTTTTVITCPATAYLVPPIDMPGVQWSAACHQVNPPENVQLAGVVVGSGPLEVRGQAVSTLHVRLSFAFAGIDHGTSPDDFWISTGRGLIVREQEVAHITDEGVHYTEQMDTRLTSLAPTG